MTDLVCSVCWTPDVLIKPNAEYGEPGGYKPRMITQIQGTIICRECLEKAVKAHKKNKSDDLPAAVEEVLEKENDIYD